MLTKHYVTQRKDMRMKININELKYNMHHFDEKNFDYIFDVYMSSHAGKIDYEVSDIKEMSLIFKDKFESVFPDEYVKIQKMTFHAIDQVGLEVGFGELFDGLCELNNQFVSEYLRMALFSYNKEELCLFRDEMKKSSKANEFKEIINQFIARSKYSEIQELKSLFQ